MSDLLQLDPDLPDELLVGVVRASGVRSDPSPPPLLAEIDAAIARVAALDAHPAEPFKKAVRDLLRCRGYKPSGRGKPASEYLAEAARAGEFPRLDVLVDINNLVSLQSGLPISVLDLGKFTGQPRLRFGREGERYVFNRTGQEIELRGLLTVCDGDLPRGTPVKDGMATKVGPQTSAVLGVIYGTSRALDRAAMAAHVERFADLLTAHAGAGQVERAVLPG
ncbi:MAG: hypothetical protein JXR83_16920 [Deltaproteobacteria bacterium]|nr:hypothetical protein [Deltaproteobacteria bacterium]